MKRKLWILGMAAVIGLANFIPRPLPASQKTSTMKICLAPGDLCDNRDQCCSHQCNKDPGAPGTCS